MQYDLLISDLVVIREGRRGYESPHLNFYPLRSVILGDAGSAVDAIDSSISWPPA